MCSVELGNTAIQCVLTFAFKSPPYCRATGGFQRVLPHCLERRAAGLARSVIPTHQRTGLAARLSWYIVDSRP